MIAVVHNFNKRPSSKNASNRSLSFQVDETALVADSDTVKIKVTVEYASALGGNGGYVVDISLSGKDFLRKLEDKKSKTNGKDYFVFKF